MHRHEQQLVIWHIIIIRVVIYILSAFV